MTSNEWRVAKEEFKDYYLYVVIIALSNSSEVIEIHNPFDTLKNFVIKRERITYEYEIDFKGILQFKNEP